MTARLTLAPLALVSMLAACATAPGAPPAGVAAAGPAPAPFATREAVGHKVDEISAINGPPSQQWDLPDGRRAYQWQASSVTARVGAAQKRGEIEGAASQTTCYYTLYAKPDAKAVWTIVGFDSPRPGCLKLAMNGIAK